WTTFSVRTADVTAAASVTLSAGASGNPQSAVLTVLPSSAVGASLPLAPEQPVRHIAVLRPSTHQWIARREDGSGTTVQFGGPDDLPVPADYLATGEAQIAVFRPST